MSDDIISFNTNEQVKKQLGIRELYQLVPENDPILREVMPEWDFKNPPEDAVQLASNLVDTCMHHRGYGLSANQCGLRHRVFVMGANEEYVAFFNPKIVSTLGETHMIEGCLSFPLLGLRITRPQEIEVEYQDYNGTVRNAKYTGISARCFQHELDHMNGIVYTSRVKPLALQQGMKKRNKLKNMVKKMDKNLKKITK